MLKLADCGKQIILKSIKNDVTFQNVTQFTVQVLLFSDVTSCGVIEYVPCNILFLDI